MINYIINIIERLNNFTGFFTLIVTIIAAIIAFVSLCTKRGHKVDGWYYVDNIFDSEEPYISKLYLRNQKDKLVTIYNIYIRFGHNIYLEILQNGDSLNTFYTLEPYGALSFEFGPVIAYSINLDQINVGSLLSDTKGTIVLSTSDGLFGVKTNKHILNPNDLWYKNMRTAVVQAIRYNPIDSTSPNVVRVESYGDKLQYLIISEIAGKKDVFPVYSFDTIQIGCLRGLDVTEKDLESKDNLYRFLLNERQKGTIKFDSIEIRDERENIHTLKMRFPKLDQKIIADNWFVYHIIGPIQTFILAYQDRHQDRIKRKVKNKIQR